MRKKISVRIHTDYQIEYKMKILSVGEPETRANGTEYSNRKHPWVERIYKGHKYFIADFGGDNDPIAFDMDDTSHHSEVIRICRLVGYPFPKKINDAAEDA